MGVSLKDATGKMGSRNDGIVKTKAARGQTVMQAYGKDTSSNVGSKSAEQQETMAGGINDLSKSLGERD